MSLCWEWIWAGLDSYRSAPTFAVSDAGGYFARPRGHRTPVTMHCDLVRDEVVHSSFLVFNDTVVNKTNLAQLNTYDLYIDKIFVASYRADGMIVATPTGSTAYSLSAGGLFMPTVQALVVTPVAPHALTHRPLVVPDSAEIEIVLHSEEEVAYLSLDGQPGVDLQDGDRVRCRRSEHQVNLFRTREISFMCCGLS